jgi:hypothetical protein
MVAKGVILKQSNCRLFLCVAMPKFRNTMMAKAENNILEAKQCPAIQRNLTKNTI